MIRVSGRVLSLIVVLAAPAAAWCGERDAAELFPATTAAFVEFPDPPAALSVILDHPLRSRVESLDAWKQATAQQQYRNFLTGRKFFEIQMGREWREAIESISSGGIAAGFDTATQGVAVVMRGADEDTMELFRVKLLELTRLNEDLQVGEYRGIPTYQIDANHSGAAVVNDWLVVTNKAELGRYIIDRLVDGDGVDESLAADSNFRAARAEYNAESSVRGFLNLDVLREVGDIRNALDRRSDNPGAELIVGGIQSALQQAPWASGELTLQTAGVRLTFSTPLQDDWIPEERRWFFGPESAGRAPELPEIPETLLTLSAYRDVSEMWLRAGDLFDENMNDQLAEADSNLTTLFAGRDFGEDILGSFEPEIGFLAVRQQFDDVTPAPAIRLPAFALVLRMREPETMTRELRRTFQSMIGFFNVVGAMQGQPQLELDMERTDDGELVTSSYIPEEDERESTQAGIIWNFSPTVGFRGDHCVISSSAALARSLVHAVHGEPALHPSANTRLTLNADVLRTVLADNRAQLVSQNMLEEGHTRDEAEAQIALLLDIVHNFRSTELSLETARNQLRLNMELLLAPDVLNPTP